MTKNIISIETLPDGWRFYGKSGASFQFGADIENKLDITQDWFVGWIQKGGHKIIFVNHIKVDKKQGRVTGQCAEADTRARLLNLKK